MANRAPDQVSAASAGFAAAATMEGIPGVPVVQRWEVPSSATAGKPAVNDLARFLASCVATTACPPSFALPRRRRQAKQPPSPFPPDPGREGHVP